MALAELIVRNTFALKLYRAKFHQVDIVLKFDESIDEEDHNEKYASEHSQVDGDVDSALGEEFFELLVNLDNGDHLILGIFNRGKRGEPGTVFVCVGGVMPPVL